MKIMQEKIDKLNREKYIEFIKNLIINSEQYKRNIDSNSYVIAIDSPWGTGKSYFIDLFLQSIRDETSICAVNYNAWKNDYRDNAFEPLIYDILTSDCLQFSVNNNAEKENIKKLANNIVKICAAFGKSYIEKIVEDKTGVKFNAPNNIHSAEDFKNFMLREIPNLTELNSERESFDDFKKYLRNAIQYLKDYKKKLVIIIDELDRCKPTFAIQTLEIVKHLFDIENIVFIFAVDIQQLSFSISSVYGQGFDSVGYLCRFFDYIAKMPAPDIKNYISDSLGEIENFNNKEVASMNGETISIKSLISDFILKIYHGFNFSLRDLDTVLQSLKIMLNNFLFNYESIGAYYIYIFYLSLKYKRPEIFNAVFLENSIEKQSNLNDLNKIISTYFEKNPWIKSSVVAIKANVLLSESDFIFKDINNTSDNSNKITIVSIGENYVNFIYSRHGLNSNHIKRNINSFDSLNHILFKPDLMNWENIKNLTFKEYLHKQLEMYGFPDIEEKGRK